MIIFHMRPYYRRFILAMHHNTEQNPTTTNNNRLKIQIAECFSILWYYIGRFHDSFLILDDQRLYLSLYDEMGINDAGLLIFKFFYMLAISCVSIALASALFLHDYRDYKKKVKKEEENKQIRSKFQSVKILLTGGPCGGKSEGINCIYHSFKAIAAPVFIVPEAATIIGTAGLTLDLSQFQPRQIELFQIYLMKLQYNLEENVLSIANNLEKLEKTPIVLCDRGLLDGKAYAGDENWSKMLKEINITEQQILNRYKAAVHMVTAAKGAEIYYNYTGQDAPEPSSEGAEGDNDGLRVRKQSPAIAVDLDDKIQKCYKNHPNRYIISNEFFVKNFEDKKTVLLAQVYQIISQIIQRYDLSEYYMDYQFVRKNSEENINLLDHPSPYLIRKRKFQKFMRRSNSPSKEKSDRKRRE